MLSADTNVLLRYVLKDDEAQFDVVKPLLEGDEPFFISNIVFCELVWTLRRAYKIPKGDVAAVVRTLVGMDSTRCDEYAVGVALASMDAGGDFADAMVAIEAGRAGAACLYTFDRGFARRADPAVCRVELLEA
ncbi:MAG: type II toxin-antitoxin system VapC family toxin [Caenispirillum bisanense]|nr:type II toxin-antitoxin system VapC family toxin [Caenispirillum bisanense]MCA1974702.1 type II toxin-antitoxin system VapC family toxin [Caenispirillum sp.]